MFSNYNLFFLFLLIFSSMMMIFNNFWFSMWIYLEINMISFIYLMINYKNKLNLESSLIYFLIQTMASILLLLSIIFLTMMKNMNYIIMISLFVKMGMSPFHFWMIMMIEMLNWTMVFYLLTWQKLSPLILFFIYNNMNKIILFLMISMMIGSMLGLNYSSLKKILMYSSINQLNWLMMSLMMTNKIFKIYFIMYMFMMFITIYLFNLLNMKYIYNLLKLKSNYYLMFLFCNLLSLGGLPPFIGFYPKFMIINYLNNNLFIFMMILFTLFTLYYYIRIMISSMMINFNMLNIITIMNNKVNKTIMFMMMMSNLMLLIFIILN